MYKSNNSNSYVDSQTIKFLYTFSRKSSNLYVSNRVLVIFSAVVLRFFHGNNCSFVRSHSLVIHATFLRGVHVVKRRGKRGPARKDWRKIFESRLATGTRLPRSAPLRPSKSLWTTGERREIFTFWFSLHFENFYFLNFCLFWFSSDFPWESKFSWTEPGGWNTLVILFSVLW